MNVVDKMAPFCLTQRMEGERNSQSHKSRYNRRQNKTGHETPSRPTRRHEFSTSWNGVEPSEPTGLTPRREVANAPAAAQERRLCAPSQQTWLVVGLCLRQLGQECRVDSKDHQLCTAAALLTPRDLQNCPVDDCSPYTRAVSMASCLPPWSGRSSATTSRRRASATGAPRSKLRARVLVRHPPGRPRAAAESTAHLRLPNTPASHHRQHRPVHETWHVPRCRVLGRPTTRDGLLPPAPLLHAAIPVRRMQNHPLAWEEVWRRI